jgi:16S rRNA (adenine1518-N6/adenine1519-N6)-dimethyltransferase
MHAKAPLGQNFLVDPNHRRRILEAVRPQAGETIIEIGPGQGALTEGLLASGASIVAVELDRKLIPDLEQQFGSKPNFHLIQADATELDFCAAISPATHARVVANLPYYISTAILQSLISQRQCIGQMTLMLQREVVERISARPGGKEYGYLSVIVQLHCDVKPLFNVPPGAFRPVPKVFSTVVRLETRHESRVPTVDEALFLDLTSIVFSQRRKTIFNNLRANRGRMRLDSDNAIASALAEAGLDAMRRAETLSIPDLAALTSAVSLRRGNRLT